MFQNKVSATILKAFVTPESWLQSTHPLSAAATIAFARLAIHCVEAGNFEETSDIVGCAALQARAPGGAVDGGLVFVFGCSQPKG